MQPRSCDNDVGGSASSVAIRALLTASVHPQMRSDAQAAEALRALQLTMQAPGRHSFKMDLVGATRYGMSGFITDSVSDSSESGSLHNM